ncbi:MAG: FABP family protein [Acidimicrobiia bacterium]
MTVPLHLDIEVLAALVGSWRGHGRGEYPTIEPFDYDETVQFTHIGKPFLAYAQRTRHTADGRPLHAETGYWRAPGPGLVEAVLSHPTGIVEVQEGTIDGGVIRLTSTAVVSTTTAKQVVTIERDFMLAGDDLSYRVRMAAAGQPLTHHLAADLRRIE